MMLRTLLPPLLIAAVPALCTAAAPRPKADLACESTGMGPRLDCTLRLTRPDGTPLPDAQVKLGASMPSMPMAHSVRPVAAVAGGKAGVYRASLELQMTGVWAIEIDIAAPTRDRIVRTLRVVCEDDKRCAAAPAGTQQTGQKH